MTEKILLSEQKIAEKIQELASQISMYYKGSPFVLVGVLKGACAFTADLQRALYKFGCKNFSISFITLRSYTAGTESSKQPRLVQDIDFDPQGKHVLVIDEVIDTGISLSYITDLFQKRGAASIKTCVLISKPSRREISFEPDYIGFTMSDVWLEGYGMDTDEYGRGNPDIIEGPSVR